uniref:Fibronectin type-III domain-containing protein n=1 Tax=Ciona savignyi TaxID=51511 RepID=H2YT68_CIOSA
SVVLRWNRIRPQLKSIVRLYRAGTNVLSRFLRNNRRTQVTLERLRPGRYEATVASYNSTSGEESAQSNRLLIQLV